MKKIFLFSVCFMAFHLLFAQEKSSKITYGIKAGFTFPKLYGVDGVITFGGNEIASIDEQSVTSFYVGGVVNIPVGRSSSGQVFIQPGLSFVGKGGKEVITLSNAAIIAAAASQGLDLGNITRKVTLSYLEIPVNLMVDFKMGTGKLLLSAGPYLGFALGGEENTSSSGLLGTLAASSSSYVMGTRDLQFGSGKDYHVVDFGFNFMAGYQLKNGLSFNLEASGGAINIDANSSDKAKIKNGLYSVGLGYSF